MAVYLLTQDNNIDLKCGSLTTNNFSTSNLKITSGAQSFEPTSGALQVIGGVGITKNVCIGTTLQVTGVLNEIDTIFTPSIHLNNGTVLSNYTEYTENVAFNGPFNVSTIIKYAKIGIVTTLTITQITQDFSTNETQFNGIISENFRPSVNVVGYAMVVSNADPTPGYIAISTLGIVTISPTNVAMFPAGAKAGFYGITISYI